jgi:hypothetical protein
VKWICEFYIFVNKGGIRVILFLDIRLFLAQVVN